jgi:bifunctional non-homologous end joining protein LigD
MLARSGALPTRGRWAFEVKWDGFRALVRAGSDYRVRSRRGWEMTALVPDLQALPDGIYDGELVAFDDGIPWFPDVCARLLNDLSVWLTFMVFDVLALDGRETMRLPYHERRRLLEQLDLPPVAVVSDCFDDGGALFDVVRERGLEGVVAKRLDGRYVPGERVWVKVKNRETWWRYEREREGVVGCPRGGLCPRDLAVAVRHASAPRTGQPLLPATSASVCGIA